MTRGCFVTGTDTGVGKTVVATAIVRGLRARGIDAVGMKPIETGVHGDGPADGLALHEAADGAASLEDVCPVRFALPAAPAVAAAAESRRVDLAAVHAACAQLSARHDFVVVEGAGGLLVPIADDVDMADLALALGLPLVIVARTRLGTINHTRLTLDIATARGLEIAGVIFSHGDGPLSPADRANYGWLRTRLGPMCIGEIDAFAGGSAAEPDTIDLDRLLGD